MTKMGIGMDRFADATPRPWHVYEGGNFVRIGAEGYDEYIEREHYMGGPLSVAETEYHANEAHKADHGKAMANAELIVAAVNAYSPADAEQLGELRSAAEEARKWFRWYKSSRSYPSNAPVSSLTVLGMLEAALNPPQPGKETQEK